MPRTICFLLLVVLSVNAAAQQLVIPGDNADPSVVKIKDTYWASATTSNWMPAYPLLRSKDLVNWKTAGHVFNTVPAWADYYFWAPEITYDNGKVYIYYAAHKKGGNLCVAIASADNPQGPYKDHGPIICEEAGSIDAFPMRDENGKLYLIWKEDGNSIGKPTPIWIQELNEERTAVTGAKKELFRNDAAWEGNLIEGVSMIRHNNYIYAFYAGAGCCGASCNYQSGVARSKSLLGPWEKFAGNPILVNEGAWVCPGHGTPVEKEGRFYFLYHAYDSNGTVYTGRQGLLKEFVFTPDNWIKFLDTPIMAPASKSKMADEFSGKKLHGNWQWSVFQNNPAILKSGRLMIQANDSSVPAFIGHKTYSSNYTAITKVQRSRSDAAAGFALVGDDNNHVVAWLKGNTVELIQTKNGKDSLLGVHTVSHSKTGWLAMQVRNGKDIHFLYGNKKKSLQPLHEQPFNAAYLPPWDRALRVGLGAKGLNGQKAIFESFEME
jgi:xylan 1,4-beta-xylosidase